MHRELDSRITPEGDVIGLWWDDETDVVQLVIEPAEGERCSVPVAQRACAGRLLASVGLRARGRRLEPSRSPLPPLSTGPPTTRSVGPTRFRDRAEPRGTARKR